MESKPPSRSPTKHELRSARMRAALIDAARPLFAARGFAGVGTEQIVRAAGVTRGALYHHFDDKTELFAAVFEQLEAEVTERIAAGALAVAGADPLGALAAAADEMLGILADPGVERVLLLDAPVVLGWERFREIGMSYGLGLVSGALDAAMEQGQLPRGPVRPLAHLLIGALDEGALYVARAEDRERARREVLASVERLLGGLRSSSG